MVSEGPSPSFRDWPVLLEGKAAELARGPLLPGLGKGLPADEVALLERDTEAESGLPGSVVGGQVRAPVAVALLKTAGLDRPVAGVANPQVLAGLQEQIVDFAGCLYGHMELPAKLADVGHPHCQDRGTADAQGQAGSEWKALVVECVIADALQQGA